MLADSNQKDYNQANTLVQTLLIHTVPIRDCLFGIAFRYVEVKRKVLAFPMQQEANTNTM